jgi:hypothetical protein
MALSHSWRNCRRKREVETNISDIFHEKYPSPRRRAMAASRRFRIPVENFPTGLLAASRRPKYLRSWRALSRQLDAP